jgi:phosphoglucosamine mutase
MGRLFGTDGIRGIAHEDPITSEMGVHLGRAFVDFCRRRKIEPDIVIGRDTRESGEGLLCAVQEGVLAQGGGVYPVDEMPTPGVAYLVRDLKAGGGIVISASHNPFHHNGFKVFGKEGFKLSEKEEFEIEEWILSDRKEEAPAAATGSVHRIEAGQEKYASFLRGTLPRERDFTGMKVVLDCANGATSGIAPSLFEWTGAEIESLFVNPDGRNINLGCGSEHTESLTRLVLKKKADVGLAFDGDGDRLIAVDEKGCTLTGDQLLTIFARMLKERGDLRRNLVVSTVMSNVGFPLALREFGVEQVGTSVGDRHVLEEMRRRGAVLGGEDSGHIIFLDHHTTGDGLLSGLQLLAALRFFGKPLSQLSRLMTLFPQVLINVPVRVKSEISTLPRVVEAIQAVERKLGSKGRVLVRYSGTEPLCRVMVEGEIRGEVEGYAGEIAEAVRQTLG